tara:strand:+ start:324 stop:1265 length:942 start_codon:yes stop_codon:yes gene_type:complete
MKKIKKNSKIFISGHKGLVGSSILRLLNKNGYKNVHIKSKKQLNLLNQQKVFKYLYSNKFDLVIIAAAKVGGINANNVFRAQFIYENLQIQNNLIHGSFLSNVKNLIFFGSSCVYPKYAKQPIKEDYLLSGKLENTNEPYAIAKIAGIKMCESYNLQYGTNYKCLMPTNTFGENDNFDLNTSHFIPAIIRKIINAKKKSKKELRLWGSGKVKREIMYVGDIADACLFFMNKKTRETLINIGTGYEKTIKFYANFIKNIIYPELKIKFNYNLLDGTPRKIMNNSLSKKYGWKSKYKVDKLLTSVIRKLEKKNNF